jgi:hypothetical protein
MADYVYLDPVAPEAFVLNLVPGTSGVDLSTVTAASFIVRKPDGAETTWTVTRTNATASTLTCTHVFVAGDVDIAGEFVVYAKLTIPSGFVRSAPQHLTARGRFEV